MTVTYRMEPGRITLALIATMLCTFGVTWATLSHFILWTAVAAYVVILCVVLDIAIEPRLERDENARRMRMAEKEHRDSIRKPKPTAYDAAEQQAMVDAGKAAFDRAVQRLKEADAAKASGKPTEAPRVVTFVEPPLLVPAAEPTPIVVKEAPVVPEPPAPVVISEPAPSVVVEAPVAEEKPVTPPLAVTGQAHAIKPVALTVGETIAGALATMLFHSTLKPTPIEPEKLQPPVTSPKGPPPVALAADANQKAFAAIMSAVEADSALAVSLVEAAGLKIENLLVEAKDEVAAVLAPQFEAIFGANAEAAVAKILESNPLLIIQNLGADAEEFIVSLWLKAKLKTVPPTTP